MRSRLLDRLVCGMFSLPACFLERSIAFMKNNVCMVVLGVVGVLIAGCEKPAEIAHPAELEPVRISEEKLSPGMAAAVVNIQGKANTFTGCVCNVNGKPYVVTSQTALSKEPAFTFQTHAGEVLKPQKLYAATDADVVLVQCVEMPAGVEPLELVKFPDPAVSVGDRVTVLGQSDAGRGFLQLEGKLLSVGAQRMDLGRPAEMVTGGSPVVHFGTKKVVGMVALREEVKLGTFEHFAFFSEQFMMEEQAYVFGQRLDAIQKWEPMDWQVFQQTEAALKQSIFDLRGLLGYLGGGTVWRREFKELQEIHARFAAAQNHRTLSQGDKEEAVNRLFRDLDGLARKAQSRVAALKVYSGQKDRAQLVVRLAAEVQNGSAMAKRQRESLALLLQRH